MYDRLRDLLIGEQEEPKREKMASTKTIIKRLDAKKAMEDNIKGMFDKYKNPKKS